MSDASTAAALTFVIGTPQKHISASSIFQHLASSVCFSSIRHLLSSFPKKLPHYLPALVLQNAGGNFYSMIQETGIANAEVRFDRPRTFIARAVNQSFYSRLYQRTRTHNAGFDRRINDRIRDSIVAHLMGCITKRDDLRMGSRILICDGPVPSNRQNLFVNDDACADRNLATFARVMRRSDRLTHPLRVHFSFFGGHHD